jgi:outer membrane protein assembly factor BamE
MKAILLSAVALILAGCSSFDSATMRLAQVVKPYRVDMVQGNFISREAAAQVQPGISREQVRLLLGTPLIQDVFHANQWSYVFYLRRGDSALVQQRQFTVTFDGDVVVRAQGDDLPSEYELIKEMDGLGQRTKVSGLNSR